MSNFAALNHELSKLYKNIAGKGPKYLKSHAIENILIIKINWYPEKIFESFDTQSGESIIKKAYKHIFTKWGEKAKGVIEDILGIKVSQFYYDENMALSDNEKIVIFLLEQKLDSREI